MCNLQQLIDRKQDSHTRTFVENEIIDNTKVPVWEVPDVFGLIKLIGHAKYINREHFSVLFRGQPKDYHSMKPSIFRLHLQDEKETVRRMVELIIGDNGKNGDAAKTMRRYITNNSDEPNLNLIIEAILQHYGYPTRLLDVVDNVWSALWFASHQKKSQACNTSMNVQGFFESDSYESNRNSYSYIYLLGIPKSESKRGVEHSDQHCLIDIRTACPSTILRPHMQHAMAVGFYGKNKQFKESYAEQLIAIIRIETKKCLAWIENNPTICADAFFPKPEKDEMYRMIQTERNDLFFQIEQIAKGAKPCPA